MRAAASGVGALVAWALLPVKDLLLAKSRLSGVLSPSERRALAQAMVEDVLQELRLCHGLDGVLMISDDSSAELLAHKYAIELATERELVCSGLNGAVHAGRDYLARRGVDSVVVMHTDLPLLRAEEVQPLLKTYKRGSVLIVTDLAGTGTNIMLMPTRPEIALYYGKGSCQAHQQSAAAAGMTTQVVRSDALGLDVDNPDDLLAACHQLRQQKRDSNCSQLLLASDIAQRLLVIEQNGLGLSQNVLEGDAAR